MHTHPCIWVVVAWVATAALPLSAYPSEFKKHAEPFLSKYCYECHDDETQKGDVSLYDLSNISDKNAGLWKQVWEQVALKEMPPKKEKNQPELLERLALSDWITEGLTQAMKDKGGFHAHMHPAKGNHLDHDLLFGVEHKNLKPASTPARVWRIHPQEHLVRLNALISKERPYNPERPGQRTRGDHIPPNKQGETKVYYGLERYIGHVGGTAAYAASVSGFPAILSATRDHGLRNYPFMYSVNSAEASQIARVAETILRFMANGPVAEPYQFADKIQDIPKIYKHESIRGLSTGIFYGKESKRPLTPVYDLMSEDGVDEKRMRAAVDFLFESLALRPPTQKESDDYLEILKTSIKDLGKEDGAILGMVPIFLDRDVLFRPELAAEGQADEHGRVMLQGVELSLAINAAFSYLKPDKTLRDALDEGKLKTREDVRREVTRILNDDSIRKPRVLQFFREFFDYDLAPSVCKDNQARTKAGGGNRPAYFVSMNEMVACTDRLVELILEEDREVLKALLTTEKVVVTPTSDWNFFRNIDSAIQMPKPPKKKKKGKKKVKLSKEEMKAHQQAKNQVMKTIFPGEATPIYIRQSQFEMKDKPRQLTTIRPGTRLGILTHPSWLVSHSDAMDNHAIMRGKWIRERLLGDATPDVPITVDAMLPDEPGTPLRHRMRVTREKECWRCHKKMDPLGLPFEMYNHVGLNRDNEQGKPVDTSGEIIDSGDSSLDGPVKNAIEMIEKLAESERVEQVFVRHVFRYWVGRNETINDAPILQEAHKAYRDSNGSMKALITSILTSDAYLYRTVDSS